MNLEAKLKEYFGYSQFRGSQQEVIQNLLDGNDTFVIMPTGAGKSICYQLPAVLSEGTAIIISPLIALMKNQVDQLNGYGINACFLNSTLNKTEANKVRTATLEGKVKLLYVAPETLTKEENVVFLKNAKISFVAVDEVHCISEWGHDFRPEYRKIRTVVAHLGKVPLIALTATATPKVQLDIIKNLQLENAKVFKTSFRRKNLFYEVLPKTNSKRALMQFIKQHAGQSGIIYCLSRKKVEEIAEFLRVNEVNALPYHAGLDTHQREKHQDIFLKEEAAVIVATIAFGMGIDKPDVRFVVHYDAPKSLEGYYQETGRAGRDGKDSQCLMFYSYSDIVKLEKFNKDKPAPEREAARLLLDEVAAYADAATCRTKQLLHYFGEHVEEDCGFCDNCKKPKSTYEGQMLIKTVLDTIDKTGEMLTIKQVSDVLKGVESQLVRGYDHHRLDVFASMKEREQHEVISIIRQASLNEFIEKDIQNYGVVILTEKGKSFIKEPHSVLLFKDNEYPIVSDDSGDDQELNNDKVVDDVLYTMLKKLRKDVAQKKNLPPYVIFQEQSLEEMATFYPKTLADLAHINGVGGGKAQKFGKAFVDLIKKYVEDNDIAEVSDGYMKTSVNKSKNKIFIIQQIDKKVDIEEIADSLSKSFDDVLEEMEHICHAGTKLNIDYYLESIELEQDQIEDVFEYFMNAKTDSIEDAMDEFDDEYTEDELRLIRIKFISEVAN